MTPNFAVNTKSVFWLSEDELELGSSDTTFFMVLLLGDHTVQKSLPAGLEVSEALPRRQIRIFYFLNAESALSWPEYLKLRLDSLFEAWQIGVASR